MFGEGTAAKLIEKWGTFLKHKIIKEAKNLTKTSLLQSLIHSAEDSFDGLEDLIGEQSLLVISQINMQDDDTMCSLSHSITEVNHLMLKGTLCRK